MKLGAVARMALAGQRVVVSSLRTDKPYWLVFAGGGLFVRGMALVYEPGAYMVAGAGCILLGLMMVPPKRAGGR